MIFVGCADIDGDMPGRAGRLLWAACSYFLLLIIGKSSEEAANHGESGFDFLIEINVNRAQI